MENLVPSFLNYCGAAITPLLAEYEFELVKEQVEDDFAKSTYRNGDRYIEVMINTYYLDGPPHCDIDIGEGSDEWIETDWNKVGLWQFLPSADSFTEHPYDIANCGSVQSAVDRMRDDLLQHCREFLEGNLERFYAVRRASVQSREPYRVYRPTWFGFGRYKCFIDPESAAMKEKYSR